MKKKYKVVRKKNLSKKNKEQVFLIMREENDKSILSNLNKKTIFQYLEIVVNSSLLDLYVITFKQNIVGYSIISKKPKYLISEFLSLKFNILNSLILNYKFITIINLVISFLRIDMIFLNKASIKKINQNYNLNLLAIKNKYQSKGLGKFFLFEIFKNLKKNKNKNYITCETFDARAVKFYIQKCKFKIIGSKIRFFKNLLILGRKVR
tara:strand:+ start:83 stop:706 length:624 start_codon:yes stop_codon:yes gene_type:complete